MLNLINLFAAIALLVFGTSIVRTGMLQVFGSNLRNILNASANNKLANAAAGLGITALLQSSTATGLIASSFVGQGIMSLSSALAALRGADVGTALMVMVFSHDLSWIPSIFILVGVILFLTRGRSTLGRVGNTLVGLGIIMLALKLISAATQPLVQAPETSLLLSSITSDIMLELLVGALLAIFAYSSLAAVLLISALAAGGAIPLPVALGLVLGANLGAGILAILNTLKSPISARRVQVGNFLFKAAACLLGTITLQICLHLFNIEEKIFSPSQTAQIIVWFHLGFNLLNALIFLPCTDIMAKSLKKLMPKAQNPLTDDEPKHLDLSALSTPSLAISCAAREAMHQADIVETMLRGMLEVIRHNDMQLSEQLRKLDDKVDKLYSAIKYYITKISRSSLNEKESQRWTDILSFTLNMEQIGDMIERSLLDIESKKIKRGLSFSEAGMEEITSLHTHLVENLRLCMSVFLNGDLHEAEQLLEQKTIFRELCMSYANSHFDRLHGNTPESVQTSSLHLDLVNELRRINSHICSVAYPILESAGVLAPNRLLTQQTALCMTHDGVIVKNHLLTDTSDDAQ